MFLKSTRNTNPFGITAKPNDPLTGVKQTQVRFIARVGHFRENTTGLSAVSFSSRTPSPQSHPNATELQKVFSRNNEKL